MLFIFCFVFRNLSKQRFHKTSSLDDVAVACRMFFCSWKAIIKKADFLGKSYVSLSVHYLMLATLLESVLPVYTCGMFYFVWSLLIIILVHHYWLKISQKTVITFFLIVKIFFLKQNSFLHLWLLLIFVSLAVFTVALFTGVFIELAYDALALWKKKRIRTSCNLFFLFFFCFVCFKCYCFCLHWIKALPYSANKVKLPFTDFFLS